MEYAYLVSSTAPTNWSLTAYAWGVQQTRDKDCATLTINSAGTESATGLKPASCW